VKNTIIDSGPLIALFDRDDKYHKKVVDFLKSYDGKLITTWAVITEVTHLLSFNLLVQIDFLRWVHLGGVEVVDITNKNLKEIIEFMDKYVNVPMDLADGSLMVVAQNRNIKDIVSIDSDYDIYRTVNKEALNNLLRV
jgi:predicted nucleic acid-binding protein